MPIVLSARLNASNLRLEKDALAYVLAMISQDCTQLGSPSDAYMDSGLVLCHAVDSAVGGVGSSIQTRGIAGRNDTYFSP